MLTKHGFQTDYAEHLSLSIVDLLLLFSIDLMQAICRLHGVNVIGVGFTVTLESVTMKVTSEYNLTNCELYMDFCFSLINPCSYFSGPLLSRWGYRAPVGQGFH